MANMGSSSDRMVCVNQMHSRKCKVEHDEIMFHAKGKSFCRSSQKSLCVCTNRSISSVNEEVRPSALNQSVGMDCTTSGKRPAESHDGGGSEFSGSPSGLVASVVDMALEMSVEASSSFSSMFDEILRSERGGANITVGGRPTPKRIRIFEPSSPIWIEEVPRRMRSSST
eukprot:scaffold16760_cov33-Phaeocystis_antarctica.AAC.1